MAKVKFKRYESTEEALNSEIDDGSFIVTKTGKSYIDYGNKRVPTNGTLDNQMSDTSENSVENKTIKQYVDNKITNDMSEAEKVPTTETIKGYVDKAIVSYGVYKDNGNLEFKTTSGFQGFDIPLNNVKYSKNLNDKFTLNSDGSISVGKGVNLIKISASFTLNRGQSGYIKTYITKNGSDNSVVIGGNTFTDYYPSQAPLTPVLLEVQEGDVLRLRFSTSADSGKTLICQQCNQTIYLTIEEV